jgi:hypothetical protein
LTERRPVPNLRDVVRKNVLVYRPNAWATSPIEQDMPCSFGPRVLDGEGIAP